MKAALYGTSALQYWRASSISSRRLGSRCKLPDEFVPKMARAEHLYMFARYGLTAPVHVLVQTDKTRRNSNLLACHLDKDASSDRQLVHIGKSLYVSSPEQVILQLAACLSHVSFGGMSNPYSREILLTAVMCELAGNYRLQPESPEGFRTAAPILDLGKLTEIVSNRKGQRGIALVRRSLSYVLPNSNSPAETQLVLFETLPIAWGGEGMKKPELNLEILTTQNGMKKPRYGDQCWPEAHRIIEYNGGYHEGERANDDDVRRNALIAQGFAVNVVNKEQLHNADALSELLKDVANNVGVTGRHPKDFLQRRSEMRSLLFEACGTRCVENRNGLVPDIVLAKTYPLASAKR